MSDAQWSWREGELPYEAAVYAGERKLLKLGLDRSVAMDFVADDIGPDDRSGLGRFKARSGLLGFVILGVAVVFSFTWRWWAFLLGIGASVVYYQLGKIVFARLLMSEGLKNKDIYDRILERGGWRFSSPRTLEELRRTYEESSGAGAAGIPGP